MNKTTTRYTERVKRLAELAERKPPAPVVKRRAVGSREAEARRLREEQAQ